MKRLTGIEFEADGGGRFYVYRNGERMEGYSNREYKAQQRVTNLKIQEPDEEFHYEQVLKVNCSASFDVIEEELSHDSEIISIKTT